jgi:hypothetical protein
LRAIELTKLASWMRLVQLEMLKSMLLKAEVPQVFKFLVIPVVEAGILELIFLGPRFLSFLQIVLDK